MSLRAAVVAFALIMVFLVVGAAALDAANTDAQRGAGDENRIVNESFDAATDGYQVAEGGDNTTYSAPHAVEVRDRDGNEVSAQNYNWNPDNGTLTTAQTGSGFVDYSVYQSTAQTEGVFTLASLPQRAGGGLVWLFFVFVVVAALVFLVKVVT